MTDPTDPLRNPKDPLRQAADAQRELFTHLSHVAVGFPTEHVMGAAINLLVNAIRQENPTQTGALANFDELAAQSRAILAEHYVMGQRRNVFPFHQIVEMPLFSKRSKRNGSGA